MSSGVTVDFNANVARFSSAIDKATNDLNKFQSNADRVSANVGKTFGALGVGVSVAGLAASVKSIINMADEMAKMSQRVGINVRELAAWGLAADLSGASIESVAKGVKGLSTYMVTYGDRLKKAGIDTQDANKAMVQLADVFAAMPDGMEKTALATTLFGKAGLDMIPMLNLGSKGLGEIRDKADDYGKRLAELAPDAEKFNDQLTEMAFLAKVVGINLAATVTGPMADWLEANNEGVRIAGGFGEMLRLFVFNLDALTTEKPAEEIRRLTAEMEKYQAASALGKFVQNPTGDFTADHAKKIEFLKFLQRQQVTAAAAKLGDFRDARDLSSLNKGTAAASAIARSLLVTPTAAKGKTAKAGNGIIGPDDVIFDINEAVAKQRRAALDARDAEDEKRAADNIKRLNDLLAATPTGQLEKAREEMIFLADALEKGAINEAQFTEAAGVHYGKAAEAIAETNDIAQELGMTFSSAFEDAVVEGKKLSEVLQGLAKDVARIFLRKTVTEPLSSAASDLFKGFDFGTLFGGGRASGGPVSAGQFYVVGENGPEILLPNSNGTVLPNRGSAGGAASLTVNIIGAPSQPQVQQRSDGNGGMTLDVIFEQVDKFMAGNIASGRGAMPAALGNTYGLNRAAGAF